MLNMRQFDITIYANDRQIHYSRQIHMKIFMSDVSAYNTHPDFWPEFQRKKCVLYAENYGIYFLYFIRIVITLIYPVLSLFIQNKLTCI